MIAERAICCPKLAETVWIWSVDVLAETLLEVVRELRRLRASERRQAQLEALVLISADGFAAALDDRLRADTRRLGAHIGEARRASAS